MNKGIIKKIDFSNLKKFITILSKNKFFVKILIKVIF